MQSRVAVVRCALAQLRAALGGRTAGVWLSAEHLDPATLALLLRRTSRLVAHPSAPAAAAADQLRGEDVMEVGARRFVGNFVGCYWASIMAGIMKSSWAPASAQDANSNSCLFPVCRCWQTGWER